jgi:hypothetical protein
MAAKVWQRWVHAGKLSVGVLPEASERTVA